MTKGASVQHKFEGQPGRSYEMGYSLHFALGHSYKRPHTHRLPPGWRWLKEGEFTRLGDVACDNRIPPVTIISGGDQIIPASHPVRRRREERK